MEKKKIGYPTASNFNWLFHELQKALETDKNDLKECKRILATDIQTLVQKLIEVEDMANSALSSSRNNLQVLYRVVELLKDQERNIKGYHNDFPAQPWPGNSALGDLAEFNPVVHI